MLKLKGIKKDYVTGSGTVHALRGVNIGFRKKEFVSILGPSGCGKTTLLNIIGGLDHYTDGDLIIGDRSTKLYRDRDWDVYRNHRVGFIFQSYNLIPHQTVLGNVELALTIAGIGKEERVARAKRALDRVGLEGQYYKKPNQLSGGQCQRVAIARALVNDPEILLADEPTGALDTVTSVQIMDLIKEISGERLVIMVTHNPDLAEQYSTRIVRLLDGEVIEDTNPMTDEEEEAEAAELTEEARVAAPAEAPADTKKKAKKPRREKAKMSFFTAFRLSARNLISKKGRTTMIGIAGSIGILGIALVLAFRAGINGYIVSMQDDMLSGNPIVITETGYDMDAVSDMMSSSQKKDVIKHKDDHVYINSIIERLIISSKKSQDMMKKNELTEDYINYVLNMPEKYYSAMTLGYGLDLSHSLYTDYKGSRDTQGDVVSISRIIETYTAILNQYSEYRTMASLIPMLAPTMEQMPDNLDYVEGQYKLLHGDYPTESNEILLVLNSDKLVSDLVLACFGFYSQDEFFEMIWKADFESEKDNEGKDYESDIYVDSFSYDELCSKVFYYYPADSIFEIGEDGKAHYLSNAADITGDPIEIRISGIVAPRSDVKFGSMQSGIYYTEALAEEILALNSLDSSSILNHINTNPYAYFDTEALTMKLPYEFEYIYTDDVNAPITAELILSEGAPVSAIYNGTSYSLAWNEALSAYVGTDIKLNISPLTVIYDSAASTVKFIYDSPASSEKTTVDYDYTIEDDGSLTLTRTGINRLWSTAILGPISTSDIISMLMGNYTFDLQKCINTTIRMFGAIDLPSEITIFPLSFDDMDLVTDYLDLWNDQKVDITLTLEDGSTKTLLGENRKEVTYTNTLDLIIGILNTLLDIVAYALIAFTSVSLVVSTVMIGIITFVSVVERIKEIGVIRALGGRKRDVSNLFLAETGIIGFLAGLIGILLTYGISLIVNLALRDNIGYFGIAALPVTQALLLIALSVGLTLISGLFPARSAAKKDPVVALRTE